MQKLADQETGTATISQAGEALYERMREALERDHYGSYVMINIDTGEHVVAPTTSEVVGQFIETFGEKARGWCTRIGVSVFMTL